MSTFFCVALYFVFLWTLHWDLFKVRHWIFVFMKTQWRPIVGAHWIFVFMKALCRPFVGEALNFRLHKGSMSTTCWCTTEFSSLWMVHGAHILISHWIFVFMKVLCRPFFNEPLNSRLHERSMWTILRCVTEFSSSWRFYGRPMFVSHWISVA